MATLNLQNIDKANCDPTMIRRCGGSPLVRLVYDIADLHVEGPVLSL